MIRVALVMGPTDRETTQPTIPGYQSSWSSFGKFLYYLKGNDRSSAEVKSLRPLTARHCRPSTVETLETTTVLVRLGYGI